jgi:polyhydroxyalkanoate synthesis repressor PhaR
MNDAPKNRPSGNPPPPREIKKYPNRRFYDVTDSRHVTLNDLYEIVRGGGQIEVTDSKTGADITNVVLTQIMLEHDPPKLELFPPALLHQAIQSNQQMIRRFIDEYYAQAMDAFVASRRRFDDFLAKSGFSAMSPTAPLDWVRMLFPAAPWGGGNASSTSAPPPHVDQTDSLADLKQRIASLSAEVESLRKRAGRSAAGKAKRRKSGTKRG